MPGQWTQGGFWRKEAPNQMIGRSLVGVQEVPTAGGLLNQASTGKLPIYQERNIILRCKTGIYVSFIPKIDQLRRHTAA